MSGWFELNRNGESQYHFALKAGDGDPILSSKTYQSKVSAQHGIGSVQAHSQSHDRYEKRVSQKNQPYFVLKDTNSQIIGLSQLHSSTAARDADMASVKTYGNTATVKDNTSHDPEVFMPDEQQQQKPSQVRAATSLLWCSLIIGILISYFDSNPVVKNVPVAFFATVVVAALSVMALLIYKLGQGRNWARITLLVLFAIGLIPYIPNLIAMFNSSIIAGALSVTQLALQLVALYWVFTKPGSLWFQKAAELECSNKTLNQPDTIKSHHQVNSSVKRVSVIKGIVIPVVLLVLSAFLTIKMSPLAWLLLIVGLVICIIVFVKSKARKRLEKNPASVSNEHLGGNLLLRSGLALLAGPMVTVAVALFMILTNNDLLKKTPLVMAGSPSSATALFGPNGVPVTVQTLAPNITNIETQGNLESKNDVGCVGPDKLSRKFTPPDMYKAAAICAQQAMIKEGAFLVALAGAYGHFDTLRVTDKTAYGAPTISRMSSFGSLDEKKRIAFQASIKTILDDPNARAAICNDVIRIGAPDYFPRYMIQHGMGAFTRDAKADNGLVEGFDARAAWLQTLGSFLHCADYVAQQPSVTSAPN